jgi:WD40 repeat protein
MRLLPFLLGLLLTGLPACKSQEKKKELPILPPGYDVQRIEKTKLVEELDEISGIWYDPSGPRIIAENDEEGKMYIVDPATGKVSGHTTFHAGGDFEDLTTDGTYWYMLRSNGNLFRITGAFTDSVKAEVFKLHLPGYNNFESLFFNPSDKKAYLVCKQCEADSGRRISIYAFNTVTSTYENGPVMTMVPDRTLLPAGDSVEIIKPSALAIHPITGEWYIMASVNHLLIVADPTGKWKKVYPLNKDWFKQPEGMSFAPNGDLYVSNEARSGTPNIIKVPWVGIK